MGQHPDPRKPTPAISRDGPYRFTRNPMYVGGGLVQLGIGIALGNAWIVALLIPVVLLIHYGAILPEERYLERKFGDEYTRFKASVRRWL
jgi:protein-S-isoprenylcysteine O-methyltransferase Ste14